MCSRKALTLSARAILWTFFCSNFREMDDKKQEEGTVTDNLANDEKETFSDIFKILDENQKT